MRRFQHKDDLNCHLAEQGITAPTTLAATRTRPRPICFNCKHKGHLVKYCIKSGRGMAGKMIDEACNAQRAAAEKWRNRMNRSDEAPIDWHRPYWAAKQSEWSHHSYKCLTRLWRVWSYFLWSKGPSRTFSIIIFRYNRKCDIVDTSTHS